MRKCYPLLSLCARRDANALTEACVADTDFTSLGGLALQTASFAVLCASRVSKCFQCGASQRATAFATAFKVLRNVFFSIIRTEVRAPEHFAGENYVKGVAFMISFLPSHGAVKPRPRRSSF